MQTSKITMCVDKKRMNNVGALNYRDIFYKHFRSKNNTK